MVQRFHLILRVILLRVCCELLYETDFSECSNLWLSLKGQRILVLLWAQYCKIFGRCFNKVDKTSSSTRFNIYKEVSCVEMPAQLTFLEEILLICVYLGRASSAYPT